MVVYSKLGDHYWFADLSDYRYCVAGLLFFFFFAFAFAYYYYYFLFFFLSLFFQLRFQLGVGGVDFFSFLPL